MTDEKKTNKQFIQVIRRLRRQIVSGKKCREAKECLRQTIIDNMVDIVSLFDTNGIFLFVTPSVKSILGHEPDSLIGHSGLDYIHANDREMIVQSFMRALETGREESTFRFRHADGQYLWIEAIGQTILENGHPTGLVIGCRDITQRKMAEEELQFLTEKMNDILWTVDLNLRTTYVSPSIERVLGFKPAERVLQDIHEQVTPQSLSVIQSVMARELREEKRNGAGQDGAVTLELAFYHRDGSVRWLENIIKLIHDKQGNLVAFHGVSRDITERKGQQDSLAASERRFRAILEQAADIILLHDLNGRIVDANRQACEKLGYAKNELLRMKISDIDPEAISSGKDQLWNRIIEGRQFTFESHHIRKDGISYPVEVTIGPIDLGKETLVLGLIRDISARLRIVESLRQSEENFHRSLDESPLGIRIVTSEGDTVYANKVILDIYGYDSIDELKNTPVERRYSPESYAEFQERRARRRQGRDCASDYPVSIITKEGQIRHLHAYRKSILWDNVMQYQVLYRDVTDRKRAEEALRENEARFRQLSDAAVEGIIIHDSGRILDANQAACIMFGYDREEVANRYILDFIAPEFRGEIARKLGERDRSKEVLIEIKGLKKDQSTIPIEVRGRTMHYMGTAVRVVAIRDLTERLRLEEGWKKSEFITDSVTDSVQELMTLIGRKYVVEVANDAYCRAQKRQREEIQGRSIYEICRSNPYFQTIEPLIDRCLKGEILSNEAWIDFPGIGKRYYTVNYYPYSPLPGEVTHVVIIWHNITEHKVAEEALMESQERLQFVLEGSHEGLWDWNLETGKIQRNERGAEMLGFTTRDRESSIEQWLERIHPENRTGTWQCLQNHLEGLTPMYEGEYQVQTKDGSFAWILDRGRIVKYSDQGQPLRMSGTHTDITQRKATEIMLREQGILLRNLSASLSEAEESERKKIACELHDQIGQNLTALGINLNIIGTMIPPKEAEAIRSRLTESLSLIEQTTVSVRNLMANLRPPVMDDYGLVASIKWYGEQWSKRTGISFSFQGENIIPRPKAPVELTLFRIVQEALTNVSKHAQARQVEIKAGVNAHRIVITIVDDGIGFDLQKRGKPDGSFGWGLEIMAERAKSINGCFTIDSQPGAGTQIHIEAELWALQSS
jgi:PAS domain S-box-containing protein